MDRAVPATEERVVTPDPAGTPDERPTECCGDCTPFEPCQGCPVHLGHRPGPEVLAEELDRYGIPPVAGLEGLLRHIYGNRDTVYAMKDMLIESQAARLRDAEQRAERAEAERDDMRLQRDHWMACLETQTASVQRAEAALERVTFTLVKYETIACGLTQSVDARDGARGRAFRSVCEDVRAALLAPADDGGEG